MTLSRLFACLLAVAVLAAAGCTPTATLDDNGPAANEVGNGEPTEHVPVDDELAEPFEAAEVMISTAAGEVALDVFVADTSDLRRRGLQGWPALPERTGMLFVFPGDTRARFWMQDTLIPLSIAFIDADGRIHTIMDMEPCAGSPCPHYNPGRSYRYALEVQQGAFGDWGVEPGSVLEIPATIGGHG